MSRAATSPELVLYRTPGKRSKIRAAIFQPTTIFTARINQVFATFDGILELTYDGSVGSTSDIRDDMTLFVGSSAGAHDVGICRVRSIDGTKIYIGETSDVEWADNQYLTIVDDFGLWARHVLIDDDGVAFMDGGIAYSDQHADFDPTPIMGSNRVVKLVEGSAAVEFDLSSSYTVDGTAITAYLTGAPTGSVSGGTTATPTVTVTTAGWHRVYSNVTADNGKNYSGVRYIYAWDDDNQPPGVQIDNQPHTDTETGGWEFSITLTENCDLDTIRDHALVILFSEDYYGDTQADIGPVVGAENIICQGWIGGESINWNPEQGYAQFTVYGAHYWLAQIPSFPDGVEFVTGTPAAWTEMQNLTVRVGLWHFLHWRTTATRIMDVFLTQDIKLTQEVSSLASTLWEQVREMSFLQIYARAGVNAWGQLHIQTHPQLVAEASRGFYPTVLTITKKDWRGEIEFERITKPEVAVVSLSGVAVNAAGMGSSYFALSPGHAYPHFGAIDIQDHLLVSGQSDANQKAGLYRGWRNNELPEITITLDADIRLIDCFPIQQCAITINAEDTPRGIAYSGNLFPTAISLEIDPDSGYIHRIVTFEAETFEDIAVNGDIPGGRADPSTPPTPSFPSLPAFPIILPGTSEASTNGATDVLFKDAAVGLIVASNFDTTPVYSAVNAGLPTGYPAFINWMCVCPNGAVYVAFIPASQTFSFLYRAPSVGGTFVKVFESALSSPTDPDYLWGVGYNPSQPEQVAFIKGVSGGNRLYVGAGSSYTAGVVLNDGNIRQNGISFGLNAWLLTHYNQFVKVNAAGTSVVGSGTSPLNHIVEHLRASTTGITFHPANGADAFFKGDNNLATEVQVSSGQTVSIQDGSFFKVADCDPTGQYIMTRALTGARALSTDFAATWGALGSLPVGNYCFGYAGSASRWIAAGAVVRSTLDGGVTWITKENSSLTAISPFPNINLIQVLAY